MEIKELPDNFIGVGEVSGLNFNKIASVDNGFLYEVGVDNIITHFEVFERKLTPICIDFEKKIYSETEFKVRYPKAEDFGKWAWTYTNKDLVLNKLETLK